MSVTYTTRIPAMLGTVDARANQIIHKAGLDMLSRAKDKTPVRTGFLKNSGAFLNGHLSSTVYFGANYAAFVELGTSKMGAQPFLLPAFAEVAPTVTVALRAVVA